MAKIYYCLLNYFQWSKNVEETIEKVINFFDSYSEIEIINIKREIL